jgi:hypothetical protein
MFSFSRLPWPILTLLALQQACGQGPVAIRGVVADPSGALVPGARVTVSTRGAIDRQTATGPDGSYTVVGLAPGRYTVKVATPGLVQSAPATVELSATALTLNITLRLAIEKQEITVEEQGPGHLSTDSSQNASGLSVSGDSLDAIADDPDDLQADLAALAGPAAGPSGAEIFIDGFSAADGVLPAKNAIREIRVNQNPFAPEFDSIGVGRVEILTKPGFNRFHGSAAFNYGNGALNSRNPYALEKAPFDLTEYSGNLSGALNARGSYFVDLDQRTIDNGSVIHGVTLDPSTFAIIDPYTAVALSPISRQRISPRVDYRLSSSNTLTFRYGFTRTNTENGGIGGFYLPSTASNMLVTEHAYQGMETSVIGTHVVNEIRFQLLRQHSTQTAAAPGVGISVAGAFVGGGASNPDHSYIHHHYELQDYFAVAANSHSIKAGVRLRAVQVYDTSELNHDGVFTFSSIQQYQTTLLLQKQGVDPAWIRQLGGGATQLVVTKGNPYADIGQVDLGFFAGDDWRVRPNLTFTYGLRYETQTNISDHSDISPRLGFAWAPGNKATGAKTVLRAGFGIFYERFEEQNGLLAARFNGLDQLQYTIQNPDTFPLIPTALPPAALTRRTVASNLRAPYITQGAFGFERQLPGNTAFALTWTGSHGLHLLRTRNINSPLPGTWTGVPGSGVFPFGPVGPIYEMESAGIYNQNLLVANVNSRVNNKISLFAFYTWSNARSSTDGVMTSPANTYSLDGEYGPANTDIRNRGNIGGTITSFGGLRVSPLIVLQTGAPFNITSSQDIYGSTLFTARPGIATDASRPGLVATSYGRLDPNPIPGETILGRNSGRGPGFISVDVRIARTFSLNRERSGRARTQSDDTGGPPSSPSAPKAGPNTQHTFTGFGDGFGAPGGSASATRIYRLTISVSGRNVLNHLNPGPIVGNISSPLFGQSNQIGGGAGAFGGNSNNRRIEFQLRLDF